MERKVRGTMEAPVSPSQMESIRRRIVNMFRRYAPDKLHKAEEGMEHFCGKEAAFLRALVKKYGPELTESELEALRGAMDPIGGDESGASSPPKVRTQPRRHPKLPPHIVNDGAAPRREKAAAPKAVDRTVPAVNMRKFAQRVDDELAEQLLRANQFLVRRDRVEEQQAAARDELDMHERLELQRLNVQERDERRTCAFAESRRCVEEGVAKGRELLRAELDEQARRRWEDEQRAEHNRRMRHLAEREGRARIALREDERRELRALCSDATQSLAAVHKTAVRRERAEKGSSGPQPQAAAAGVDDAEKARKLQEYAATQQKRLQILEDRARRRREQRAKDRADAAEAEKTVHSFLRSVRETRMDRQRRDARRLRHAVAESNSAITEGGISYCYLGSAPRRPPQHLPPIDGGTSPSHRAHTSLA